MLSASDALVARFQALDQRLTEIATALFASHERSQAHQRLPIRPDVAKLQSGDPAQAGGFWARSRTTCLDQRDQLIAELNKSVRVSTVEQNDGSINIFIGSGQPLVVGNQHYTLKAIASAQDPKADRGGMKTGGSNAINCRNRKSSAARWGLSSVSRGLAGQRPECARPVAIALALNINDQHRLGMDLTGAMGGAYFNMAAPVPVANADNTGTASIGASFRRRRRAT